MKRKAIIIGSPLYETNNPFSSGVRKDMGDYLNFFASPTGGAYYLDEIEYLENPTINELKGLKQSRNDFSVVAFSGHGAHNSSTKESILTINDREKISISNLIKLISSPRQLIILDSCRNFIRTGGYYNLLGDIESNMTFDSNLDIKSARSIYDNHLRKTSPGAQVLYSCAPGEFSFATHDGSYFSKSLLSSIKEWSGSFERYSVMTSMGAFKAAANSLRRYTKRQHPGFARSKDSLQNFPFAIRYGTELFTANLAF